MVAPAVGTWAGRDPKAHDDLLSCAPARDLGVDLAGGWRLDREALELYGKAELERLANSSSVPVVNTTKQTVAFLSGEPFGKRLQGVVPEPFRFLEPPLNELGYRVVDPRDPQIVERVAALTESRAERAHRLTPEELAERKVRLDREREERQARMRADREALAAAVGEEFTDEAACPEDCDDIEESEPAPLRRNDLEPLDHAARSLLRPRPVPTGRGPLPEEHGKLDRWVRKLRASGRWAQAARPRQRTLLCRHAGHRDVAAPVATPIVSGCQIQS